MHNYSKIMSDSVIYGVHYATFKLWLTLTALKYFGMTHEEQRFFFNLNHNILVSSSRFILIPIGVKGFTIRGSKCNKTNVIKRM